MPGTSLPREWYWISLPWPNAFSKNWFPTPPIPILIILPPAFSARLQLQSLIKHIKWRERDFGLSSPSLIFSFPPSSWFPLLNGINMNFYAGFFQFNPFSSVFLCIMFCFRAGCAMCGRDHKGSCQKSLDVKAKVLTSDWRGSLIKTKQNKKEINKQKPNKVGRYSLKNCRLGRPKC